MKKSEAEKAIRYLCHEWAKEKGIRPDPMEQPSFQEFTNWLNLKGYSHYLNFKSRVGALESAELWFDQEFKQTWRN